MFEKQMTSNTTNKLNFLEKAFDKQFFSKVILIKTCSEKYVFLKSILLKMDKSNNEFLYYSHASSWVFLADPVRKQALKP